LQPSGAGPSWEGARSIGPEIDTIIVRAVLVTALNLGVGSKMWWPSAMSRVKDPPPSEAAEAESVPAMVDGQRSAVSRRAPRRGRTPC
jgi:hypothetical protein